MIVKGTPSFQFASLLVKFSDPALKEHDSIRVGAKQIIK